MKRSKKKKQQQIVSLAKGTKIKSVKENVDDFPAHQKKRKMK